MIARQAYDPNQRYCRICGNPVPPVKDGGDGAPWLRYDCRTCGRYRLDERAAQHLYELTGPTSGAPRLLSDHHLLSALIRSRYELTQQEVPVSSLEELLAQATPLPGGYLEAVDRLLLHVTDKLPRLGGKVILYEGIDYPVVYAQDGGELFAVVELAAALDLVGYEKTGDAVAVSVKPAGWVRLQDLRTQRTERRQAFVAMWFSPETTRAYTEGIARALRLTGYEPLRIDHVQHNDKIDDRIIAAIRRSGLLVADFTGHRGGVYFEAGFAMGLDIPVVWTCRADAIDRAHFDTRQYNHIVWDGPDDLCEKLRARIEATLPTYPPIEEPTGAAD